MHNSSLNFSFFDGKDQRVNVTRYFLCGFFSVMLHGLTLSAKPIEKITMPIEEAPTSLNLQFTSFAAPPAAESPQTQTEPQEKISKVETLPKVEKAAPKKITPKKPIPKKIVKKTIKKKAETKKPLKQKTEPKKTPVKKNKIKDISKKAKRTPDNTQAENTQSASSARPLIAKPAFKIKPKSPPYPRYARKRGLEGTVLLEVWLDKRGKKEKVMVLTSSGHPILDKAALKAVNQWQFKHHEIQGNASASRLHIPIRFNLD